nr:pentatricopeptide repeat-containing protein At2g20540 [Tanacetum cinerariifolium]
MGNLELAVIAMEHLLELEPKDTENYVLLSNIYADSRRWDGVSRVRKFSRGKIMAKTPGCNSIEVDNVVEEFMSEEWRGKWGPLVAKNEEGGGWEEEVRWCDGGERD